MIILRRNSTVSAGVQHFASLEIPSGSLLGFRFKVSYSRNFSASPVIHLGALRSGFALTSLAAPPFAKIFDFVQNGSSWRRIFALLNFVSLGQAAHIAYAFIRLCPRYRVLRFRLAFHKIRFLKIPSGSFFGFRCKISSSRNFFASPVIHLGVLRSGFALTFVLRNFRNY